MALHPTLGLRAIMLGTTPSECSASTWANVVRSMRVTTPARHETTLQASLRTKDLRHAAGGGWATETASWTRLTTCLKIAVAY